MNDETWLIDDDRSIRWVLERALTQANIKVRSFESGDLALEALKSETPKVIISDIKMPGISGLELLEIVHRQHPELPCIIMTAHSDLDSAVNSYQLGAFDYLPKPFDIDEAIAMIQRALTAANEHHTTKAPITNNTHFSEIIGEAPAMQEVFRAIGRLSKSNITVLINGQSGTGKELVAHALHQHSPHQNQKFIALNMAAIPADLIESELFGHEKGAFTGANTLRQGRFEQADGGTLFLDEIGDMPADAQTRLLRVLSDGEFFRVGGHKPVHVNVRIIAATHQNLEKLVKQGKFREDLFHRLNVIRLQLPSLKERTSDIPKLSEFFLSKAANELGVETKTLSPKALIFLQSLPWDGNVRQLENTCRWLTVMAPGVEILVSDLPPEHLNRTAGEAVTTHHEWPQLLRSQIKQQLARGETGIIHQHLTDFENIILEEALAATNGRKAEAAELIGWGRNTLTRKLNNQ